MADPEEKERFQSRRKMERVKVRRDQGDMRGAFATKVTNPVKPYKRVKIDVKDYEDDDNE